MNNHKNLVGVIIYILFLAGFGTWFVIGAYYFSYRSNPPEKLPVATTTESETSTIPSNSLVGSTSDTEATTIPSNSLVESTSDTEATTIQDSPTPTPEYAGSGIPKSLSIEKLNINTSVGQVGLDNEGNMDVPESFETVAWYKLGYKIGRGSAVLSGHYDDTSGNPAVFWDLNKLESGDLIKITDTTDITYTYKVISKNEYPYDSIPLEEIFATRDNSMLNLITCSGKWDKSSKNYLTRTVIYTQQVQ